MWSSIYENNGAVFLPAAGMRYALNVRRVNEIGYYHSSTLTYNEGLKSLRLYYENTQMYPSSEFPPSFAASVRLVHDAN